MQIKPMFKKLFLLVLPVLVSCAAIGPIVVPLEEIAPPKKQTFGIGTQIYFWNDSSRSEIYTVDPNDTRQLLIQIWYPAKINKNNQRAPHIIFPKETIRGVAEIAGLPAGLAKHGAKLMSGAYFNAEPIQGQFPLIVFSHGDGGILTQNMSQIEALVAEGYVVIACNHTFNAVISFDQSGLSLPYKRNVTWDQQASYQKKYYTNRLIDYRLKDVQYLIAQLKKTNFDSGAPNPLHPIINFDKIGIFGHSMGGGTSYLGLLEDDDFDAALALDGWFFGLSEDQAKTNTNKPFMHIAQEQFKDIDVFGDINDSESGIENDKMYSLILKSNHESYVIYLKESLHYTFTDFKLIYDDKSSLGVPINTLGGVDKKIVDLLVDKAVLDFFNYSLKDQPVDFDSYKPYEEEAIFEFYSN